MPMGVRFTRVCLVGGFARGSRSPVIHWASAAGEWRARSEGLDGFFSVSANNPQGVDDTRKVPQNSQEDVD
jgi:hypothetical protein